MIHWLYPGALGGLALLALPIVIHLLRTHRAERILFPSLRFVKPSRSAAVRPRPPSDLLLLCVRLLIVAAAVLAAAQPVVVTARRVRGWDNGVVRAVILDNAGSTPGASGGADPTQPSRQVAANEMAPATRATLIESATLADAVIEAADWLAAAPPARRELVLVSAFRIGTLGEGDLAGLPPGTGVRLVQPGQPAANRAIEGPTLLAASGVPAETQAIELAGARTRVTLGPGAGQQAGLRVVGEAAPADVDRLLRSVAAAGTAAPAVEQPLLVAFGPDAAVADVQPLGPATPRWMLRTVLRAQADRALADASGAAAATELPPSASWTTVAADRGGHPLVRLAVLGDSLAVQVAADPASFVAAAALRALLQARAGDPARPDQEILRIPAESLAQWARPAAAVEADAWRRIERSDARWFWLAALLLLGAEHFLRRLPAPRRQEVRRAA